MGPSEAISTVLRKYFTIDGRASRSEYWWWTIGVWVGLWVLAVVLAGVARDAAGIVLLGIAILWLVAIIPSLTVFVRRLHDTGRSGWWWLIGIIPFGGLVLLVFTLLDSDPGPNRWGPPPVGSRYADPSSWRFYQGTGVAGPQPGWGQPQQPTWPAPQPAASWQSTPAPAQPAPAPGTWQSTPAAPQPAAPQPAAPAQWQAVAQPPQPPAGPPSWPNQGPQPPTTPS